MFELMISPILFLGVPLALFYIYWIFSNER